MDFLVFRVQLDCEDKREKQDHQETLDSQVCLDQRETQESRDCLVFLVKKDLLEPGVRLDHPAFLELREPVDGLV
ncbi:Putative collagen alpha-1iv chain [Caligus rogercresseyi]|uniref:Collagen alpha-1iv chain n=1 Tax=Caligus rogercresseyi TaxID=217165 RepID=A0A7T8QSB2_CALRO|nr:Putative collagen alpha-1iv chain [Caligus rogercresseyi]